MHARRINAEQHHHKHKHCGVSILSVDKTFWRIATKVCLFHCFVWRMLIIFVCSAAGHNMGDMAIVCSWRILAKHHIHSFMSRYSVALHWNIQIPRLLLFVQILISISCGKSWWLFVQTTRSPMAWVDNGHDLFIINIFFCTRAGFLGPCFYMSGQSFIIHYC